MPTNPHFEQTMAKEVIARRVPAVGLIGCLIFVVSLLSGCVATHPAAFSRANYELGTAESNTMETARTIRNEPLYNEVESSQAPPLFRFQDPDPYAPASWFWPATDVRFGGAPTLACEFDPSPTRHEAAPYMLEVSDVVYPPPNTNAEQISYVDLVSEQWQGVVSDHTEFYSVEGLSWLAAGFGVGALMANTGFDEHAIRGKYLENVVNISEDDFYESIHQPHFLGDGRYTIPVFALAALSEPFLDELPYGPATSKWGQRSLRTILVGGPPMLAAQVLTGASRPGETSSESKWKPFQDNNGVSGHSFMGAIPFMSAAKMTDNPWAKAGLYLLSAAPAVSRVNDDRHYFSQACLGWWMAYIAATAVDRSHNPDSNTRWFATPVGDGVGLGMMQLTSRRCCEK